LFAAFVDRIVRGRIGMWWPTARRGIREPAVATKTPPKRDVMLALLQAADSVYVNFDPRRDGVVVPPQLKRQPRVVLQYGMNMAIPIPDLDVGEEGIGATLSFDRMPTWTFVPWSAVFAIVSQDQRGMLWESDVPREVQVEQKKQPTSAPTAVPDKEGKPLKSAGGKSSGAGSSKGKRPSLRAVEGGHKKSAEPPTSPTSKDAPAPAPAAAMKAAAPKPTLKVEESRVAPGERPPTTPDGGGAKQNDEIIEPPRQEKKKRELPPYLRVVK
jgi:stringent starvation protein B